MKETRQEITSKDTCIKNFPRLFRLEKTFPELFKSGNINLDYGGGKYDLITNSLSLLGVTNLVFDPFNRPSDVNVNIQTSLMFEKGADTCTMSNVLNVIKEEEFRHRALVNARHMMKKGASIYITVHDGNRSGVGKETSKGWQENRATKTYLEEVQKVFPNASIKKDVIVGVK
jgi:hypothetical protein